MSHKKCFVIAPVGDPQSPTRDRSDKVLRYVIQPAVEECGYRAIRADDLPEPGIITQQVIREIVRAPLIVADLSERNPNVFYELALCHWLRRPLVQLIEEGQAIPFDVAGMRTIAFNYRDVESVDRARRAIVQQVRSLETNRDAIVTPTSFLQKPGLREGTRSIAWRLVIAALFLLGAGAFMMERMERLRAQATTEAQLRELQAHAGENRELMRWVSCQEQERLTGRPHEFLWSSLKCVETFP